MKSLGIVGTLFIILLCYGGIWKGQHSLLAHHTKRYFSVAAQQQALKSGEKLQPFLLGFDNFMADLYWLKAIQYVGGTAAAGEFPVLEAYANTITDFDPQFAYVYHFAGTLLPAGGYYEQAERILQKGEKNLPHEWQFPYDLGFLSFYYLEDYEQAIEDYERCLEKEECLPGARRLIATLQARTGKVEVAFFHLLEQLARAPVDEQKFLTKKLEEVGKLLVLQKIVHLSPPQDEISELVGKVLPQDSEIRNIITILQQFTQQRLITPNGRITAELLQNPFEDNPYVWNQETKKVVLESWEED